MVVLQTVVLQTVVLQTVVLQTVVLQTVVLQQTNTPFNPLTLNGHCSCRTAPLTSRPYILNIYLTNIRTEYFKHAAKSPFFSLQNAVYFIMLACLVPVLFTF
jgi:hypothetical protein